MSEGKAVTLVGAITVILGASAWLAVALLSDDGALATVAMFVVGGIGIDQMSRIGMRYDRR
ncbi:MAG TPA: hypothetical protein VLI94_07225 [Solirubrobacterales bacterium]|nr:hypothetical protein [Solirubrobacterales bacterium]